MSPSSTDDPVAVDPIGAEAVLPLLRGFVEPGTPWVAGLPFEYRPRCASTNAVLKEVANAARAGTALITDDQTAGRGRLARTWMSAPGLDLTFSVLVRPALAPAQGHLLALASAVAVAETLEEAFGLGGQVGLKWPNDVLLGGRKVCGILLEASTDAGRILWAVAGVGLNVNSEPSRLLKSLSTERAPEWRGRPLPVSLKEHLGHSTPRAPLLAALLVRLTHWWTELEQAGTVPGLLAEWRRRDAFVGRQVEVRAGAEGSEPAAAGEVAGVGDEGQLLVWSKDGKLVEVFAGDVSIIGPI